jgi:hypothetical protein
MKNINDIPNLRQIKVKYISPTNTRGSRVCIYEPKRYNNDKTKRVYLSYDCAIGNIQEQAYNYLTDKGFNVVSRASEFENYILFVDNWAEDFIEIDTGLIRTY